MDIYILVPKKPLPSPDQPEESSDSYFRS